MLENLLWAAPPIGPYAKFTQLLGPPFDFQQGVMRGEFDRQLATDNRLHEWDRVVYLAVLLLEDFIAVCVGRFPVCLQIVLTIAPPWTKREGTKDPMR